MREKDEEKSFGELPTLGHVETVRAEVTAGDGPSWTALGLSEAETLKPEEGIRDDGRTNGARRWKAGEEILGRYVVERELGQGGMGVVYGCLDKVGGVRVAVKGLPPELSHDSVEMEEVRENFRLVGDLRHPCIAGVRTLEKDERGEFYLVMDLAEGESLRKWERDKWKAGGVSLKEAVDVLRQVASALDYAHGMKVVHRDVKPGNVMIDGKGRVKMLDFGLADQIRTSLSRASHAYRGTSGTGPYMAPEQWRGQPQDGKTDQYALGVMAYEMLAGRLPFGGSDLGVLREVVLKEEPTDISGLPESVMGAIRRAMAKRAEERFGSCGEFVEALASGRTTIRPLQNTPEVSVGDKGKGRGWGWVAALLLATGVGGGVWWWQDEVGRQQLEEGVRQAEERPAAQETAQKAEQERLAAEKKAEEERLAAQKRAEEMESKRKAEQAQRQAEEAERRAQEEAAARKAEEERLAEQRQAEEKKRQAERRAAEEVARKEAEQAATQNARNRQEIDEWQATAGNVKFQDRDVDAVCQEAQMMDLSGDPLGASACYKRVEDIVSDLGTKRSMQIRRAQMLVKAAEQRGGDERNKLLDEAVKICENLTSGGVDLQFVYSVVVLANVELARGNREKARNILAKNMDIIKPIDDSLADMGMSMKDSPMAGARSLLGRLLKEDADAAANDPMKTEEAVKLYSQALTEYYNVFVKYGDSSWGPSAGMAAQGIKSILESKYGKTVKINLPNQIRMPEKEKTSRKTKESATPPYVVLPDGRLFEGSFIHASTNGEIRLTTHQGIRRFTKGQYAKAIAADGVTELGSPLSAVQVTSTRKPNCPYVVMPDGRRFEGTAIRVTANGDINLTTHQGIRMFSRGQYAKAVSADGVELGIPQSSMK